MSILRAEKLQTLDSSVTLSIADLDETLTALGLSVAEAISRLANSSISVKELGATGDGVTDDTAAIVSAATQYRDLFFPLGHYIVTGQIQCQPNCRISGSGMSGATGTRIQRKGNWIGDTFRVGTADGTVAALACRFTDFLVEQLHPGFDISTSVTMVDRLTDGQAHIRIFGGYACFVDRVWLQHAPYGVVLVGCTQPEIGIIKSYGSWDNKNAAISEQIAAVWVGDNQAISAHRFNTQVKLGNIYVGVGGPSPTRTITVGSGSFAGYENIGARYGVLVTGAEGISISGYAGGAGQDCIAFIPSGLVTNVRIDDIFLDECFGALIHTYPAANAVIGMTLGANVQCNGQLQARNCLRIEDNAGSPTLFGLSIEGGIYSNTLETAFFLAGLASANIAPGLVNNYNGRGGGTGNVAISTGAYVTGSSNDIHFDGGLYGGGANTWSASNNCQYGPYVETAGKATAANVRSKLGLAGGATVGGISQTYPT
ncbi:MULTISPECIES: glycosyl hydrolase family 28-related protein [unclassified Pseudomonas]|uniref:Glycosyl hydrolase family 28-related protein n=1 Tax=Pseudomonas sp. MYb327 TaxID=2745230 RepID=A0AAU8E905_9PSED